ncbi:ORF6N domain-containing protein [Buttiauxella sp. 3AFRM03]|uniref:ORF6N domain-containing protein n=1 Tax=Buttiauxella sp. 3AFRM03 TaxID=2479367 RepID=UPI000EF795F5|nr:ORF6N domain-containing protein [Buttiauxella sp. 3AFRM03]AYN26430.1 ORF6N domain-containing protein [Buttiauxella sp. 3AFRM03]
MKRQLKIINAENLPEIQWEGVRVVTTEALAVGYGTDVKNIQMNLTRNQERFIEGEHYFKLEGLELQHFKRLPTISGLVSKHTSQQVLWTVRGAARMSKIIDTDEAWSFFEKMESAYFHKPDPAHPLSIMPDFNNPAAAARAWADEFESKNKALGYVHRQAQYIDHLENLFQDGMSPFQFCKLLNGVNVSQINAFLADHNWLFDERPESRKAAWRVKHYARDQYLREKRQRIDPDNVDIESFDAYKPILLRKGAVWLYRHYLKGNLPMKKGWDGKFTHDSDLQEALHAA